VNVFVQVVVLLYLIDNNENTSWMIIATCVSSSSPLLGTSHQLFGSSGMGALVEAWKACAVSVEEYRF
jgi:hypothetical protein